MKRFTETDIWTRKKWFMKLKPKYKLFWYYIKDHCDSVGVWDENIELANFVIGDEYTVEDTLLAFKQHIIVMKNGKWWVKDFCEFQYGVLSEKSTSKPILSYVHKLKQHTLWIPYLKGIKGVQEKEKEEDKEKEEGVGETKTWRNDFKTYSSECADAYNKFYDDDEFIKKQEHLNPQLNIRLCIEKGYENFWGAEAGWKHKKKSKSVELDWKQTIIKSIDQNKVYWTREEMAKR